MKCVRSPSSRREPEFKLPGRIERPMAFTILSVNPKRTDLDFDFGSKMEAVSSVVCRRRNRPRPMN